MNKHFQFVPLHFLFLSLLLRGYTCFTVSWNKNPNMAARYQDEESSDTLFGNLFDNEKTQGEEANHPLFYMKTFLFFRWRWAFNHASSVFNSTFSSSFFNWTSTYPAPYSFSANRFFAGNFYACSTFASTFSTSISFASLSLQSSINSTRRTRLPGSACTFGILPRPEPLPWGPWLPSSGVHPPRVAFAQWCHQFTPSALT